MAESKKISVPDQSDHPDYHRIHAAKDSMPDNATLPQVLAALRINEDAAFAWAIQRAKVMREHMDWEGTNPDGPAGVESSKLTNLASAYMEGFLVGVIFGDQRSTPVFDAVDGDTSHRGQ
jgi:hypothetical protein